MIYICIPAADEGQTVGVVLWKVREVMGEADRDYQILVADDASTDKTSAVLEPYTRVLPLTVMRSEERRGYGASLEMLLREAVHRSEYPRRDVVVVLQADFTEDPDHIPTLLKRIESGADLVVSNVVREGRRPFREKMAGALERFVLRGKGADATVDPLEGYHAFRVSAVRRAFEQDTHARLLPWHGRAANAALLNAVIPHARRVDAVELRLRPERRQREVRQTAGTRLREAWAFARDRRPVDVLQVADLAPATVRTARTADHEVSASALRSAGVTRAGEEETPRRRRRKSAGSGNGKARGGVKDERRSRRRRADSAEEGRESGKGRRRSRSRSEGSAKAKPATETPEADTEAPKPKERRPRRGRKRTSGDADVVEAPASSAEPTGESAGEESAGDEPERRRRRRGRRGGRRRSGRSRTQGDTPPESNADEPSPPASDAS